LTIGDRFSQVLSAADEGADWAWAELYRDLAPSLLRFLTTSGAAEPEDCLAECFLQLVRNLHTFSGDEAAFRAWAFTVARSRLIDSWRAGGRRPVIATGDVHERIDRSAAHGGADGDLLGREWIRDVLGTLTTDQRAVLVLRVLDQFSIEETATIIGKSTGAVKVLQNRAIKSLRKTLDGRATGTLLERF
jgi:RNA polymerase sigma-70 factor (ECF subfamily)